NFCMDCIPVCPTGSIDEWRVVNTPYTLEEQFGFTELPPQEDLGQDEASTGLEALDDAMAALLADAHKGAGGKAKAPASATKPSVNMYTLGKPATAKVQGNYRLTNDDGHDVRHIILDFGGQPFPALEGQSIGIIPPGTSADGKPHLPRLYSISSPRDGERANYNNLSLTVKREEGGLCSNYVCDLKKGDEVQVTGPFGATFLMPDDPSARLLMICTGTGSAPMRAFTMRRQRTVGEKNGGMLMFFGARSPGALPYFGPLGKVPERLLHKHLVFSRVEGQPKEYVQDRMRSEEDAVAEMLQDPKTHIYICGLRGMEEGVEQAFTNIAESFGQQWTALRDTLRTEGRYHVETY
ncbi:MAG TPA: benzoyl-CoA oxygenase, partial [Rhodobacteraceae bacterium]|nr:benzoyl-CoA oxygenase [Paracoccaceae bacterium]